MSNPATPPIADGATAEGSNGLGGEPVTVVVTRRVKAGREVAYEAWLRRLQEDAASEFAGYLGTDVQPPATGGSEYTTVFRFDSVEHLRAFERSDLRARALREVAPLVEEDAVWRRYSGLEFWFEPPPGTSIPQPSRFRMAILLTAVVYTLVLAIGTLAAAVIGDAIPGPVRLLGVIAVEVALMTYFILPVLTRRLAGWIYPSTEVAGS